MNKNEIRAYFGTNINVRPDRLWYQHGTGALGRMPGHVKTAAARLLAAGTRPETYIGVRPIATAEDVVSIVSAGAATDTPTMLTPLREAVAKMHAAFMTALGEA